MRRLIAMAGALMTVGCTGDETVASYGGGDRVWHLAELDGAPFDATASLTFPESGKIAGQAPCNSYFANMTAPYPWFETGQIAVTTLACPDLETERRFLSVLSEMTQSEVHGDVLILRDNAGREMVFKAAG